MQYCRVFLLMFNTGTCPTSTAVLNIGHFQRRFWRQLDRLRLTTLYRERTRPNETYIFTIILFKQKSCEKMMVKLTPRANFLLPVWGQFHQHFKLSFFVQKCFEQLSLVTFQLCNFWRQNIGAKIRV